MVATATIPFYFLFLFLGERARRHDQRRASDAPGSLDVSAGPFVSPYIGNHARVRLYVVHAARNKDDDVQQGNQPVIRMYTVDM